MTINDLLGVNPHGIFKDDTVLKGDFIALDAKDGKVLFDTSRNKKGRHEIRRNRKLYLRIRERRLSASTSTQGKLCLLDQVMIDKA